MEINIRDDRKIIEIWLSKAERDNPELRDTLRKICTEYGPRKYTVAVFKSGEDDLFELTSDLLLTHRRKLAEREAESERLAAPSMTMEMYVLPRVPHCREAQQLEVPPHQRHRRLHGLRRERRRIHKAHGRVQDHANR